ncbi:LysR family transcriptional regulator [Henriciella mobilis]|uniref:LysR family transcriptional regulator n=1 Tax=Henriciella mobilis TaxID=2305467 RepID=A0A399REY6_9PROT|nr:LysR family transcriptional regulator [Henriciella mobilis]RIJ14318.1 LysR family transcriptional regulator [Henriciella mobilis]RIJ19854.1 LysR family transcriptional regulator [Henriciella mobilis]RIJ28372.1 LysR family transcriptional regulator [Henriciella mobilis]
MNWDDLKIFLDVARQPKLDEAAAHLHLDATTVSRRIKRLETELGLTLFERTRRGHALTPAGEKLADRVEAMESLSFDIMAESTREQTAAGRIRLGATEGLGSAVIAPALADFRRAHPNIDVDLIALSGFVSVPKRQADMSVLLTRPSAGRLRVRRLTDYSLRLYGTAEYLAATPPVHSRTDLEQHTLIGYTEDLIYSSQLRYLDELLPGLTPHLCSPSIVAQLEMVAAGAGLGILPVFMADREPHLVPVLAGDIEVRRSFWLAVHEDVAGLKRNSLMAGFLAELLASLP